MNLALILESAARAHPERVALVCGEARVTYGALDRMVNQLAHGLRAAGIRPGDAVAISCVSVPPFAVIYYALLKLGAVAVPLNLLLKRDEIAEQLAASEAKGYFCFEGSPQAPLGLEGLAAFEATPGCARFWAIGAGPGELTTLAGQADWRGLLAGQPAAFDAVLLPGDATSSISFTSGTTGAPKGAEHTHASELIAAMMVRDEMGVRAEDVSYSALPLFSLWRVAILHCTLLTGSRAVLAPRFHPAEAWRAMAAERVTVFLGVAPMFHAMREALADPAVDADAIAAHWRLSMYGGMPLSPDLRSFFAERFAQDIRQGYGLTEVVFAVLDAAPPDGVAGRLGRPIPGVSVRVVDEGLNDVPDGEPGEIVIRSPMAMKGYFGRPDWTAEAFRGGWFHTGDVGRRDADGTLHLLDRTKDMINRGSYKVYPAQVEAVIMTHTAVANVAVVGVPDERLGEEVLACVVLRPEAACGEEELIAWARERVAAFAYPRQVRFLPGLPTGPTGKVLKRALRAQLSAAAGPA
jgi:long-chain acyl-CoA synthetase